MKAHLKQFREQLGTPGLTGLVLLALAGTFILLTLQPLERETDFMRSRLEANHTKASMQTRTLSLGTRQKELADFFASLPAEQDVTDVLGSIYASAKATGVEFKQAEYKPEAQNNPRVEYAIIIPAQAEYPRIRLFVASVLANNPAVALDQINFQRERVNDATVKSEIRFTLFLRPESSKSH